MKIDIYKVVGSKIPEILALLNKDFVIRVIVSFVMGTPIINYSSVKIESTPNSAFSIFISQYEFTML
jgi:hypothetical protein